MTREAKSPKRTEDQMLALLAARYRGEGGNGPAWAFIPHVRNAAGLGATRTIDAIAMNLWPSRGLEIHGHEIKCSRADWLRELRDPAKAEAFTDQCDRWWLVAADATIVQAGELPPTWGLMVADGRGLTVKTQAPELPATDTPWMPRTFLAALLRSAVRTQAVTPEEIAEATREALAKYQGLREADLQRHREEVEALQHRIRVFEQESGVGISKWNGDHPPEKVGATLRAILNGDVHAEQFLRRFERLADMAERLAADAREAAGVAP